MRPIVWMLLGGGLLLGCHNNPEGGSVTSASPAFSCSTRCQQSLAASATVHLTAAASQGSTFTGWQGAYSGNGACDLTMDADRDVTAVFDASSPMIDDLGYIRWARDLASQGTVFGLGLDAQDRAIVITDGGPGTITAGGRRPFTERAAQSSLRAP